MHVGHRNERAIYNMGNHRLEEVEEEKDLGVLIHRTLSVSNNCAVAVKKANQMAGHIYRTVTHKSIQTVVPLYKALVRPHLEYCSLVWSPYPKKDILSIENGQRRVTKTSPSIHLCPNLRRTSEAYRADIAGEPSTQGGSAGSL